MGERSYFENLLRQYEASGDVVGLQKTMPAAIAAGSRRAPVGTGPDQKPELAPTPGVIPPPPTKTPDKRHTVTPDYAKKATGIYEQMIAAGQADLAAAKAKGVQTSIGTPPPQGPSAITRPEDGRGQWQTGGTPMIDPYASPTAPTGPTGPAPDLRLSDVVLDLPEYKPPAESSAARKGAAEEAYQRGRGDMGEQVHNAIISAKSMKNPNARAKFVGEVLSGMGSGLSQLSAAAGREGRAVAAQKRGEQLRTYEAKYQAESAEAMSRYDAELDSSMAQWQADMATWAAGGDIGRQRIKRATTKRSNKKTRGM